MAGVRAVACLSLLVGISLQVDVKSGKEAGKAGNFMEDEQWLSTISQYSRKIKHWNRFRDVSCVFSVIILVSLSHLVCSCWCLRCCCCRRCLWRRRGFVGSGDFCAQFTGSLKCARSTTLAVYALEILFLFFFLKEMQHKRLTCVWNARACSDACSSLMKCLIFFSPLKVPYLLVTCHWIDWYGRLFMLNWHFYAYMDLLIVMRVDLTQLQGNLWH